MVLVEMYLTYTQCTQCALFPLWATKNQANVLMYATSVFQLKKRLFFC